MLELPDTPDTERLSMLFNDLNDFCIMATGSIATIDAAALSLEVKARLLIEKRYVSGTGCFSDDASSVSRFFAQRAEMLVTHLDDRNNVYDLAAPIFAKTVSSREGGIPPLELGEKIHWLKYIGADNLAAILGARYRATLQ